MLLPDEIILYIAYFYGLPGLYELRNLNTNYKKLADVVIPKYLILYVPYEFYNLKTALKITKKHPTITTIVIAPGVYIESDLFINHNISIKGTDKTIIKGSFYIQGNVSMSNLSISDIDNNKRSDGIVVENGGHIQLKNINIKHFSLGFGLEVYKKSSCFCENVNISYCGFSGVWVSEYSFIIFKGKSFCNGLWYKYAYGLYCDNTSEFYIKGNIDSISYDNENNRNWCGNIKQI